MWLLYDIKLDTIVIQKNANLVVEIASLTKIMTAMVVIDNCKKLKIDIRNFKCLVTDGKLSYIIT